MVYDISVFGVEEFLLIVVEIIVIVIDLLIVLGIVFNWVGY